MEKSQRTQLIEFESAQEINRILRTISVAIFLFVNICTFVIIS